MSAFKPNRQQLRQVRLFARLCANHADAAARCKATGQPGAGLVHDSLARDCSRDAFALATSIAKGAAA